MAGPERGRLPQLETQECRRRAENFLGLGEVDVDVPRAIAFGLLAVAAELHTIGRQLKKR